MTDDQSLELYEKIRVLIEEQPGLHLSRIAEILNLNISQIAACLDELEKRNIFTAVQETGYKRYYLKRYDPEIEENVTQETGVKIYQLIERNPGLHLSKIAELLKMSSPLAEYHLLKMEKSQRITAIKEKGYKRYYTPDQQIGGKDKKILSVLRKEAPLKIVLFLVNHPNTQHKDILQCVDVSPSTLSYHLDLLVKSGLIIVQRYGTEKGYSIKNKQELVEFVLKYRLQMVLEGFSEVWGELEYTRWGKTK